MKKSLPFKHQCKLLLYALEYFLNGRGVADEGCGHFQIFWRHIAHSRFYIIGNPFHKMTNARIIKYVLESLFIIYLDILVWCCSICSSTSFIESFRPRKMEATVKYLPCNGLQAVIIFPGENIYRYQCINQSRTRNKSYAYMAMWASTYRPGISKEIPKVTF